MVFNIDVARKSAVVFFPSMCAERTSVRAVTWFEPHFTMRCGIFSPCGVLYTSPISKNGVVSGIDLRRDIK